MDYNQKNSNVLLTYYSIMGKNYWNLKFEMICPLGRNSKHILCHWKTEYLFSACSSNLCNLERSSFTFVLPLESKWIPCLFYFFMAISYFSTEREPPPQKWKAFTTHYFGISLKSQRPEYGVKSKSDWSLGLIWQCNFLNYLCVSGWMSSIYLSITPIVLFLHRL